MFQALNLSITWKDIFRINQEMLNPSLQLRRHSKNQTISSLTEEFIRSKIYIAPLQGNSRKEQFSGDYRGDRTKWC